MIAYLVNMFPRFSETFVVAEINELLDQGHSISVIALRRPTEAILQDESDGVKATVTYLPEALARVPGTLLAAHLRTCLARPATYLSALRLAWQHRPHAWAGFLRAPLAAEAALAAGCLKLHAHFASIPAFTALFAARLAGLPFTLTAHAFDIYRNDVPRALLVATMMEAQRVVTISSSNVGYLENLAGGHLPPGHVVRIYNGIDLTRLQPMPRAEGRTPLILGVGRLVAKKGFRYLVEAVALLRDQGVEVRCEVIGKGPEEQALRALIAHRHLQDAVFLTGPLQRSAVFQRLSAATLLIAPCVVAQDGNRDGLPTVLLEAMACGLPCVTTSVTGAPEAVVHGRTGFVARPGDPASLAEAIGRLVSNTPLRQEMGREARLRCEELFDLRKNVRLLAEIHGDVAPSGLHAGKV